jgi:hypothetical protein
MWQKWRQPAPQQQSMMTYEEYYDDDRYLETIHEVESIRSRRESVAHPPPQALPELPLYVDSDIPRSCARTNIPQVARCLP